jgi:hypothetical protein
MQKALEISVLTMIAMLFLFFAYLAWVWFVAQCVITATYLGWL